MPTRGDTALGRILLDQFLAQYADVLRGVNAQANLRAMDGDDGDGDFGTDDDGFVAMTGVNPAVCCQKSGTGLLTGKSHDRRCARVEKPATPRASRLYGPLKKQ